MNEEDLDCMIAHVFASLRKEQEKIDELREEGIRIEKEQKRKEKLLKKARKRCCGRTPKVKALKDGSKASDPMDVDGDEDDDHDFDYEKGSKHDSTLDDDIDSTTSDSDSDKDDDDEDDDAASVHSCRSEELDDGVALGAFVSAMLADDAVDFEAWINQYRYVPKTFMERLFDDSVPLTRVREEAKTSQLERERR